MFYICCRVWKIETSIGQFMVHFFYNAHSKKEKKTIKKKKYLTLVFLILFPTDNTWSLFVGSDQGFKQRSWSYTGERKEKIFEKVERWRKIVVKIQHLSDVFAHTWDNRGMKGSEGSKAGNRRQNILTTLSPQFVCHSSFHVTTLSKYNLADTQIYKYGITGKFLFINNN